MKHPFFNHVVQFIFIFSSVYFAFYLTDKREQSKLRIVEEKAILAIHRELTGNLEQLEKAYPYHLELFSTLGNNLDSIRSGQYNISGMMPLQVLMNAVTRNASALGAPQLSRTAWDTFQATDAIVMTDYDLVSVLAKVYKMHEDGVGATTVLLQNSF